jgi:hypothetical protein
LGGFGAAVGGQETSRPSWITTACGARSGAEHPILNSKF